MEYQKPSIQSYSQEEIKNIITASAFSDNGPCAFAHCPVSGSYTGDIGPCICSLWY